MVKDTKPIFIVGSGRSGTRTFFRMLSGAPGLEIHHEYAVPEIQSLAAKYVMGLISSREVRNFLNSNHSAAILYSKKKLWCDSSNKLVWIIDLLDSVYPECRFIGVVRDGRKVVPSYYYKLREEMYDLDSVRQLSNWIKSDRLTPPPPPEKRYWWNIPQMGQPWAQEFSSFDRFHMVCYHWANSNNTMLDSFERLPPEKFLLVKLEDLIAKEENIKACIEFMGLAYDPIFFQYLRTPRNVFYPMSYKMNSSQANIFNLMCSDVMARLGYNGRREYTVEY